MAARTPSKSEKAAKKTAARPVLLSGGNPQIAKAEGDLDEAQFAAWVKQASELPGERM